MNKKKRNERQSLIIATVSLLVLIVTGIPKEISLANPISIATIVVYAGAMIALIVVWIQHFLRWRGK